MKISMLLCFLLLLCTNAFGEFKGTAIIGTVTTNPSNSSTLATTGSLSSGCASGNAIYNVQVYVTSSSSSAATFDMQSVFNSSVVSHLIINVPANSSYSFMTPIDFNIPDAITLQVVNVGAITGNVQTNIYYAMHSCN